MSLSPYTGRLAPSPTGLLHLGHAATFLAAADRASVANGRLLLRIDDLDAQRSREHFVEAAREDLHWLGLGWQQEVRQSERLPLYCEAMQRLLASGRAYACTCTRRDLQQSLHAPHEDSDDEPVYNGRCRAAGSSAAPQPIAQLRDGVNYRFRVDDGETVAFEDRNFGAQSFAAGCHRGADFGDFLVWRKDGLPSYQLACVVDDAEMGVTEVVRGRDLLKSTARQILLQHALGLPAPGYFHTELLHDEHGQRLAKRHDALSLRALRARGVSPAEIRSCVRANRASEIGRGAR